VTALDERTGADACLASARRDEPFLRALSPALENASLACLVCCITNILCTVLRGSHFCFCVSLLESFLASSFSLDARLS
jgi:hypothetical protein